MTIVIKQDSAIITTNSDGTQPNLRVNNNTETVFLFLRNETDPKKLRQAIYIVGTVQATKHLRIVLEVVISD